MRIYYVNIEVDGEVENIGTEWDKALDLRVYFPVWTAGWRFWQDAETYELTCLWISIHHCKALRAVP